MELRTVRSRSFFWPSGPEIAIFARKSEFTAYEGLKPSKVPAHGSRQVHKCQKTELHRQNSFRSRYFC
jgi:hypothetical protein